MSGNNGKIKSHDAEDDPFQAYSEREFSRHFSSCFNTVVVVVVLVLIGIPVGSYIEADSILHRVSGPLLFISFIVLIFRAGDAKALIKMQPRMSDGYRCEVYRSFRMYSVLALGVMLLVALATQCPSRVTSTELAGTIRSVDSETGDIVVSLSDGTTTALLAADRLSDDVIRGVVGREFRALVAGTLIRELIVEENVVQPYRVYCDSHQSLCTEFATIILGIAVLHYIFATPKGAKKKGQGAG